MKNSIDEPVENEVKELPVHSYSKSELARAYAPEIGDRSALNRLSRWMRQNEDLYLALLQTGYCPTQQIFTCKQVGLIFKYLGKP